ncbi:MAG: hypothetical protein U1E67_16005 [Hyphomicrobiales bacterium]
MRRLIVAAARHHRARAPSPGVRLREAKDLQLNKTKAEAEGEGEAKRKRRPLFNLFDALRRQGRQFQKKPRGPEPVTFFDDPDPRAPIFRLFGQQPPTAPAPPPVPEQKVIIDDGMVSARHLVRRLLAVLDAVQDIPRHAMRLARWDAKPFDERRPERSGPLRSGRPPGYRQRNIHEVDQILKDCDWLARLGNPPRDDTS